MVNDDVKIWELERHQTKDVTDSHINGDLTVIWRDWDDIIKNHPKMVYESSVNPGEVKGPHLHKKRTSYFCCIHGKAVFIILKNDGSYSEIEVDEKKTSFNLCTKWNCISTCQPNKRNFKNYCFS